MNNEEKLDAVYQMTLENNDILRTIRRQQYFANALRALYWLVVLGAVGGAYYFVRPVVTTLSGNSGKIEEVYSQLRNQLPEKKLLDKVMDALKAGNATGADKQMPDDGVIDSGSTTIR